MIDLTKKSNYQEWARKAGEFAEKHKLTLFNGKFKVGDKIQFLGGYNENTLLQTEIFGFDGEEIYIIWDCFWFAIKDEEKRKIKLINN